MSYPRESAARTDGVNFAEIERDFVRGRLYPDFAWRAHEVYSPLNAQQVPLQAARVAFVTTGGAHMTDEAPFDIRTAAGDPSFRAFPSPTPFWEILRSATAATTPAARVQTRTSSSHSTISAPL